MELKDLQTKLVKALDEAERIRQQYAGKAGNLSGEETKRYLALVAEADETKTLIDAFKSEQRTRSWGGEVGDIPALAGKAAADGGSLPTDGPAVAVNAWGAGIPGWEYLAAKYGHKWGTNAGIKAYGEWLAYGPARLKADSLKALAAQEGDLGGFLVVPQELVQRIIVKLKDEVYMRQAATVQMLDRAESLGVPVLDTDLGDPTWTAELSTGSEDTTTPFGKRQLTPHPLARRIKISNKLLRQASIDPEAIVMDRLVYRFARTEENAFLNGNGQNQPLGIFVADANGIDTSRDTTTAAAGTVAADDILKTRYALKVQYRQRARWFMHRQIIQLVRLLKDSNGQYLWQPGLGTYVAQGTALIGNAPDMLIGHPIFESEVAPSASTSGSYVAVLGDYEYYWIADALNIQIQRLVELYAESNQTGFIGRKETDGMPVLAEAFVRLKVQ